MIDIASLPAAGRVTVVTLVGAWQVVSRFSRYPSPVMAGETVTGNGIVIDSHGTPRADRVAIVTAVGRWHVIDALALDINAVMASETVGRYSRMIHENRLPGAWGVTVIAVGAGRDVTLRLAGCNMIVVTADTATSGRTVIKGVVVVGRVSVTFVAGSRCLHVSVRLLY